MIYRLAPRRELRCVSSPDSHFIQRPRRRTHDPIVRRCRSIIGVCARSGRCLGGRPAAGIRIASARCKPAASDDSAGHERFRKSRHRQILYRSGERQRASWQEAEEIQKGLPQSRRPYGITGRTAVKGREDLSSRPFSSSDLKDELAAEVARFAQAVRLLRLRQAEEFDFGRPHGARRDQLADLLKRRPRAHDVRPQ
jgi:hypothetical protein